MAESRTGKFQDQKTLILIVFVLLALTVLGIFVAHRLSSGPAPVAGMSGAASSQTPVPAAATAQGNEPRWEKTASFGVWEVRCRKDAQGPAKGCFGILEIKDAKRNQILLTWVIGRNGKGELGTTIQTPGGVLLPRGVDVTLGEGKPQNFVFESCSQRGCFASAPLTDAFVEQSKTAEKAKLTIVGLNGKATTFAIPLAGFDKAVAAVKGQ